MRGRFLGFALALALFVQCGGDVDKGTAGGNGGFGNTASQLDADSAVDAGPETGDPDSPVSGGCDVDACVDLLSTAGGACSSQYDLCDAEADCIGQVKGWIGYSCLNLEYPITSENAGGLVNCIKLDAAGAHAFRGPCYY